MMKKFNKKLPYGEIYGMPGVRYLQGGVHFRADGTLSDNQPEGAVTEVVEEPVEEVVEEVVEVSLETMTKAELDAFAKEQYGVDLDGRSSKADMITKIEELAAAEAA